MPQTSEEVQRTNLRADTELKKAQTAFYNGLIGLIRDVSANWKQLTGKDKK